MKKALIVLYQEMADLTLPKCKECRVPLSCCDSMYCDMAFAYAKAEGVNLERTNHPTLPLMGEKGCTAPPYLRPLCTLHVCSINSLGFDAKDLKWTNKYFALRERIDELEFDDE
jgi:hypothetical protein